MHGFQLHTAEYEAFRDEPHGWLASQLPPFLDHWTRDDGVTAAHDFNRPQGRRRDRQRRLNENRWAAINWPLAWNGREATPVDAIYSEEGDIVRWSSRVFLLCLSDFGRFLKESRDDHQSFGYDTPAPLIRSDSYTTLRDAIRGCHKTRAQASDDFSLRTRTTESARTSLFTIDPRKAEERWKTPEDVRRAVAEICRGGYALGRKRLHRSLTTAAAPIRDTQGMMAAVSVVAATSEFTVPSFVPAVRSTALALSRQLMLATNVGSGQDIRKWRSLHGATIELPRDGRSPEGSGSVSTLQAA